MTRSERWRLHVMLVGVGALFVAATVGQALSPTLATEAPLLLIALNPRNSFMLLVSQQVPFWSYMTVGFVRLVLGDPLLYLLGYLYGDAARRFLRSQGGFDTLLGWLDRWFGKLGPVIVFVAPNATVCVLAGVTRMRATLFIVLNVTGTVTRLLLIWWLGDLFRDQVEWFLDLLARYQWPATFVMVAIVAVQVMLSRRRGTDELQQLERLEHEIVGDDPDDGI